MVSHTVASLEELFETNAASVYGYLLGLSGNPIIAEELTGETFYRAILALDGFRGDASVKTWLLRIARNLYLRQAQRAYRTISLEALLEQGTTFTATQAEPEELMLDKERSQTLRQALLRLSESDRSILLLFYQESLPQREIAQILDISIVATKVRLYRARQRLATMLQDEAAHLSGQTMNVAKGD